MSMTNHEPYFTTEYVNIMYTYIIHKQLKTLTFKQ